MLMQSQMLVPLDGTTNAEMILPHALFLAQQTHSPILFKYLIFAQISDIVIETR